MSEDKVRIAMTERLTDNPLLFNVLDLNVQGIVF